MTGLLTIAVLLLVTESVDVVEMVAAFTTVVPPGTDGATTTLTVKVALSVASIVGFVHEMVPNPPIEGAVQVQPAGALMNSNASFDGSTRRSGATRSTEALRTRWWRESS